MDMSDNNSSSELSFRHAKKDITMFNPVLSAIGLKWDRKISVSLGETFGKGVRTLEFS